MAGYTGIGDFLNNTLGVTSSARQQYKNQLKLQHDAQNYSTWQMQNAHQIETQDLQNAGLNPVLSAGASSGASAGVTEGSASAGINSDPSALIGTLLSARKIMTEADKNEAETAKTNTEKEILDIQKNYIAPMNESLMALNNANTGLAKQNTLKAFEETVKTNAEAFKAKIEAEMADMDVAKRQQYYHEEVELYKKQLKAGIVGAGFEGNTTYQAIDRAFATVGKVFSAGVNYSYGHNISNSNSTSNVNVHNTDYNPERHAKIGF